MEDVYILEVQRIEAVWLINPDPLAGLLCSQKTPHFLVLYLYSSLEMTNKEKKK